jgi:hypothetical protein
MLSLIMDSTMQKIVFDNEFSHANRTWTYRREPSTLRTKISL